MSAPEHSGAPAGGGLIDFSRRFIPERFTPLWHTPGYAEMTPAQRVTYNQLCAMLINEQIVLFETALASAVLGGCIAAGVPDALAHRLRGFIADEARHTEMFRRLNRQAAPGYYANSDWHFIRLPPALNQILSWATRRSSMAPAFLMLMLLEEERSLHISSSYRREAASLEPSFVDVHHRHLMDEIRHVDCDESLLTLLWGKASRARRTCNARLFGWLIREFFSAPKRGGVRVLDELAVRHPELGAGLRRMKREQRALGGDGSYLRSLYSREIAPRTFAQFDRMPGLSGLGRWLPGYAPATEACP